MCRSLQKKKRWCCIVIDKYWVDECDDDEDEENWEDEIYND